MEGLKMIPYIFLIICIAGIIGGASVITMAKFGATITPCALSNASCTLNTAKTDCTCTHGGVAWVTTGGTNLTSEYYAKAKGQEGLGTIAEQIPTVAIIAVMVIIISLIAGVFVYMKMFG